MQGGHDLLNWDSTHNVTLKVLADGMNELATLGIISPPSGPYLAAAMGDEAGFVYNSFVTPPTTKVCGKRSDRDAALYDVDDGCLFSGPTLPGLRGEPAKHSPREALSFTAHI